MIIVKRISKKIFKRKMVLFYDQFRVENVELAANSPVPTSIRVLTLDYNFIGKLGADALAQIVSTSR